MAEPRLSPPAEIVRRFDPELFHAALFATEPARERLMVLYAFDVELSRAAARADRTEQGPIIAEMRLQFWRDTVAEAFSDAEPRGHEVAGPLVGLIRETPLNRDLLDGLIDARSMELSAPFDRREFDRWIASRFGGLTQLAAMALGASDGRVPALVGRALGLAFALRLAAPMAVQSRLFLLPELTDAERSSLVRGETTGSLRAKAAALAEEGLAALSEARGGRERLPRAAVPALLPAWRAELDLQAVIRPDFDLAHGFPDPSRARRALTLAMRAVTGRW